MSKISVKIIIKVLYSTNLNLIYYLYRYVFNEINLLHGLNLVNLVYNAFLYSYIRTRYEMMSTIH